MGFLDGYFVSDFLAAGKALCAYKVLFYDLVMVGGFLSTLVRALGVEVSLVPFDVEGLVGLTTGFYLGKEDLVICFLSVMLDMTMCGLLGNCFQATLGFGCYSALLVQLFFPAKFVLDARVTAF